MKATSTLLLLFICVASGSAFANGPEPPPQKWTARLAARYAVQNNPDIGIALQRLQSALASVTMEKSSFYPRLSFSTRYSQTNNPMYSFGNILNQGTFNQTIDFNNPGRTDDLNAGLRLHYNLYNGGRDQAGVNTAKALAKATETQLDTVRAELAFAAIHAFNLIIQAEDVVKAHQSALDSINASLTVAHARFSEGVLLRADVLNLEVQQARSEENLIQARNNLSVSRRVFLNLMGLKSGDIVISAEPDTAQDIPATRSFEQRHELQGAKASVQAAESRLRKAKGEHYPSVGAFAGYDLDHGSISGKDGDSWLAGIELNYNIFDGHRTSAGIAAANAAFAEAKENMRKTELAIELEVTRAELSLNDAEARLEVTRKGVDLARESARIYRARFKEGDILASDLIEVEKRLTDALLRRTVARTSRNIAIADIRKSLGLKQFPDQVTDHINN